MKRIDLIQVEHNRKIGDVCEYIEPNVTEDSLFYADGEVVGFYIRDIKKYSKKLSDLIAIANKELAFQNTEKEKRANELLIANEELEYQNNEKLWERFNGLIKIARKFITRVG